MKIQWFLRLTAAFRTLCALHNAFALLWNPTPTYQAWEVGYAQYRSNLPGVGNRRGYGNSCISLNIGYGRCHGKGWYRLFFNPPEPVVGYYNEKAPLV